MHFNNLAQCLFGICLLLQLSFSQALETVPVVHQTAVSYFHLDGIVEATNKTTVSAQTSGKIKAVLFDVGDYVETGSVILSLNDTEQQASVKKAEAAVQEARALNLKAKQEYERVKSTYAKKVASKSSLDEAKAQYQAATARLNAAIAGLTQTQEQLSYTQILAAYSGLVTQRHVEPGEAVQPGMPLLTGISLEQLRVVVYVPQNLVNKLRKFSKASILHPETNETLAAQKITIFPYADPTTNTFKARLDLTPGTKQLYPGMFVKVSFVTGETEKLTLPAKSVVHRSEITGVYVIAENDRVSFRQIRTGGENGNSDNLIILAGLDEGEKVALDPIAAGALLIKQRKETQGE